jgi:nucleoside-diphosphate-sugar epimerase
MSRVAVTGAAGFLGKHLVARWRREGRDVLPLVRQIDARSPPGSVPLGDVLANPALLGGCRVLVHSAAIRHRYGADPASYRASNVELVERLIEAVAGRGCRFVHVSSVGVYGFPTDLPITEAHPYAPVTLYSASKVEAEQLAREVAGAKGVDLVIARPTIVYGPGDSNGMLDKMARMIRAGTYRVVGSGHNTLHHTHIDDIVQGLSLASERPEAVGEHFIFAGPEVVTLLELSEFVAKAVGRRLPRLRIPMSVARSAATVVDWLAEGGIGFTRREPPINHEKLDVMCVPVSFDVGKARRLLGYAPTVRYREGVPRALTEVAP